MENRREYQVRLLVNRKKIYKVVIDPHFELKHSKSITDEIILKLVATLDGRSFEPQEVSPPFEYFVNDRIQVGGKLYKLVWLLEENQIYIGVVNAHRR